MAIVREARLDDLDEVAALFRAARWGEPTLEGWRHLWRENPAAAGAGQGGFGWVLDEDGRAVGFLRNVMQRYRYGERDLVAAAASTLVVQPDYRGHSLKLVAAFCRQPGVDLLLNTTAAPQTAKIFEFFKFVRIPQADYDISLWWVLDERGFLRAALRKQGAPAMAAEAGAWLSAPILSAFLRVTRRRLAYRGTRFAIDVIDSSAIDDRFDTLWERKTREGKRLLAYRDARTLRWHFTFPKGPQAPRLICAFENGRLLGYLVIVRQDSGHIGLRRARVADIFVENDDEEVIRQLLSEAAREAAHGGAAMLEVVGMPRSIRRVLNELRPQTLHDRCWPFSYRADDRELHSELLSPERWHAGLYDGDGSV
jgi:hypothetical protein